jgi:hypothetical protein
MRYLFTVLASTLIFSCNSKKNKIDTGSLKEWVLANHQILEKDIETFIKNDSANITRDSNWMSTQIATTIYAPNSLGELAKIAGDSSECIIVELTFFRDKTRKRKIMIAAEDSSCLDKLNAIDIKSDSINHLIFGKRIKPLYTKDGNPL